MQTLANKIYIDVLIIGRPMELKVVEKSTPIERQIVLLKILKRKGEPMVDSDQCGCVFRKQLYQALCDSTTSPIPLGPWRRRNLDRHRGSIRKIHPQSTKT
jgi:hypothetical protein